MAASHVDRDGSDLDRQQGVDPGALKAMRPERIGAAAAAVDVRLHDQRIVQGQELEPVRRAASAQRDARSWRRSDVPGQSCTLRDRYRACRRAVGATQASRHFETACRDRSPSATAASDRSGNTAPTRLRGPRVVWGKCHTRTRGNLAQRLVSAGSTPSLFA